MTSGIQQRLRACLTRQAHSYLVERILFNPGTALVVFAGFVPLMVEAVHQRAWTDLAGVMGIALAVTGVLVALYVFRFRRLNAVRIYVTPFGVIYHDLDTTIRACRRSILDVTAIPGGTRVRTTRGSFEFTYRLVNGAAVRQLVESWLR